MSVDEIVMLPGPVKIDMFVPEISDDKLYPPALPIINWPFAGV